MDTAMLVGSLIPILAILIGGLIVLVPIAGLTARFALKPAIEAYAKLRSPEAQEQVLSMLEQRLALVEQQVHQMESSLHRLEEVSEFDRRLQAPAPPSRVAAPAKAEPPRATG